MISISDLQVDALQMSQREQFVWTMAVWLADEFAETQTDPLHLVPTVASAAVEGWTWGIADQDLVRMHVYAAHVLAPDYSEQFPMAGEIMRDAALPDTLKRVWLAKWLDAVRQENGEP